jgi:hypothetical protein
VIQNVFDFFERQAESEASLGMTQQAGHVAGAVGFNDAKASILLMSEPPVTQRLPGRAII